MKRKPKYLILLMILMGFCSCKSEYAKVVEEEMSRGVIVDSLILGMHLDMTKKEFYSHCWDLNKKGEITAGSGNQYARLFLEADSTIDGANKVMVDFYGIFDDEAIMRGMEMKFKFTSWSPWNEHLESDDLMQYLDAKIVKEYGGNRFFDFSVSSEVNAKVKIDGNMQTIMYPINTQEVMVKMEDLRYKFN